MEPRVLAAHLVPSAILHCVPFRAKRKEKAFSFRLCHHLLAAQAQALRFARLLITGSPEELLFLPPRPWLSPARAAPSLGSVSLSREAHFLPCSLKPTLEVLGGT